MTSTWSYVVKHIDDVTSVETDITTYVKAIPVFSDVGSGQVNYATLVLNALNGRFLVDSVSTQPYLDQFDKITIRVTDINGFQYAKVFEIKSILPREDGGSGTTVELSLLGIERHVQQINYSGTRRFSNAWWVAHDICSTYMENKGTKQPTMTGYDVVLNPTTKIGNGLPTFTVNNFPFGESEDLCYNRLVELTDMMGASVDAGGVRDFFELNFITDPTTPTQIGLSISSSGSYPESIGGTPKLIDGATASINVGETEGGIDSHEGSRVLAWGDSKKGSLPTNFSRFEAEDEAWFYRPSWKSGIAYQVDAIVAYGTNPLTQYKCITTHTSSSGNAPPSAFWTAVTKASLFGNSIQYSPWTDDKANVVRNCGSDVYNTGLGRGFFDSNLVIWTDNFFRTWVNEVVTSVSVADTNYQFETLEYPRGYRILVTGTRPSWIDATDINGVSTINSIVEMRHLQLGTAFTRQWVVKYKLNTSRIGMQIAEIKTGKVYQWTGASYTDVTSLAWGGDCFHPFASITNVEGVDPRPADEGWTNNVNSAIKVTYTFPNIDGAAWTTDAYKVGAWLSLQFPFPANSNGISEAVGDLYGPNTTGSTGIGSGAYAEPATLDMQNMTWTHNGFRGFNNAYSDDYGPISGIAFYMKLSSTLGAWGNLAANIPMRCTVYDINDNVAVADFTLPFKDNWTSINLGLNEFSIYSANIPRYSGVLQFAPPKELPTDRIFEWHNVKFITFQCQAFYDEDGRFFPGAVTVLNGSTTSLQTLAGGSIDLYLDGFRFVKPLLKQSGTDAVRNLEGEFRQKNYIGNSKQLENDVKSELEIDQHRHKEYDIRTTGRCDIGFGDSFYYRNPRTVNESDSDANTVKLVAKKIEHSITKPAGGLGGFLTRFMGVKRFT